MRLHLDESKVKSLLDEGILKPGEAVQAGADRRVGSIPTNSRSEAGKASGRNDYPAKIGTDEPARRDPSLVAKRPGSPSLRRGGNQSRGEGGRDPFGAVRVAGSEPISRQIRRAADDPRVAAIVVADRFAVRRRNRLRSDLARVWSGQGREAQAGDREHGRRGRSGGYYVARVPTRSSPSRRPSPAPSASSIGHFDAEGLLGKLGLNLETVKRGASADLFTPTGPSAKRIERRCRPGSTGFLTRVPPRVAEGAGPFPGPGGSHRPGAGLDRLSSAGAQIDRSPGRADGRARRGEAPRRPRPG